MTHGTVMSMKGLGAPRTIPDLLNNLFKVKFLLDLISQVETTFPSQVTDPWRERNSTDG